MQLVDEFIEYRATGHMESWVCQIFMFERSTEDYVKNFKQMCICYKLDFKGVDLVQNDAWIILLKYETDALFYHLFSLSKGAKQPG